MLLILRKAILSIHQKCRQNQLSVRTQVRKNLNDRSTYTHCQKHASRKKRKQWDCIILPTITPTSTVTIASTIASAKPMEVHRTRVSHFKQNYGKEQQYLQQNHNQFSLAPQNWLLLFTKVLEASSASLILCSQYLFAFIRTPKIQKKTQEKLTSFSLIIVGACTAYLYILW